MNQVVIENPIINSPFDEPMRHFRFSDEGITNEIVDGRRTIDRRILERAMILVRGRLDSIDVSFRSVIESWPDRSWADCITNTACRDLRRDAPARRLR
jgi:hypothetical protein